MSTEHDATIDIIDTHEIEPVVLQPHENSETTVFDGRSSRDTWVALIGAALLTVGIVVAGIYGWRYYQASTVAAPDPSLLHNIPEPGRPNPYHEVVIDARSAIVYDVLEQRILYAKEENEPLPLASLTKLMTSLVAMESVSPAIRIAVTRNALDTEGDSGLLLNETWRLSDLVSYTMMTSSNDGADAIATAVGGLQFEPDPHASEYAKVDSFVTRMNRRAHDLSLATLQFDSATGLDEPNGGASSIGSARDVARLLTYIWQHVPGAIAHTSDASKVFYSEDGFRHLATNTNEDTGSIPGLLASKTGYTDLAGGNLAVLYNAGLDHPIAVVVLGSSREGRFSDVQTLIDATYEYVDTGWYDFETAGSTLRG